MSDDSSGERVIDTETGVPKPMQRRAEVKYLSNGSIAHDYIQINVKAVKLWIGLALVLGSFASMLWVGGVFVLGPRMKLSISEAIDAKTAGLYAKLIEVQSELKVTREEMKELSRHLEVATSSRWTLIDEKIQAAKIRAANKGIVVPEPEHNALPGER